jgi:SAM-dependent methyltransferase
MDRRAKILGPVDPATARGLEIGPLDKPLARRDQGEAVWYADYTDTSSLKAHYTEHQHVYPDHDPTKFVDVDFVLSDGPLRELAKDVAPFDYVIASHVIEHIPDLVAWFDDLSSVLVPGGRVCLAIPDRRYCFDARRASTELADVVAAHLEQRTRPSPRAFFDFAWSFAPVDGPSAWRGDLPEDVLEHVADVYRRVRDSMEEDAEYQDVHVWAFSPQNLETIINALGAIGLTDLRIEHLTETEPGGNEFYARLVRRERTSPVGPIVFGIANAELRQVQAEREALREELARSRHDHSRLRHPVRSARNLAGRLRRLRGGRS